MEVASNKNLCKNCEYRNVCQQPCKKVENILRDNNRVMEKFYENMIIVYPKGHEVHFSDMNENQISQFSTEDNIPWSSGDFRLTKTRVFVERFFNKTPCKALAERYGVKENTIVCMYKQALEQIQRLIQVLDARKAGIKAMKPDRFTDDEKFFLLHYIFGFTQIEIARMFNRDKSVINEKIKRLGDRYAKLFAGKQVARGAKVIASS
jgi:hypothetical protein